MLPHVPSRLNPVIRFWLSCSLHSNKLDGPFPLIKSLVLFEIHAELVGTSPFSIPVQTLCVCNRGGRLHTDAAQYLLHSPFNPVINQLPVHFSPNSDLLFAISCDWNLEAFINNARNMPRT